jgi:phosphopantothenoylcysteine synthetase/decarboxylase
LSELLIVGVFTDGDILLNIVKDLITTDNFKESKDGSYHHLSVIVSFTRSVGEDLLGLHRARDEDKERQTIELDENDKILTTAQRESFINQLNTYFDALSQHLLQLQKELRAKERENHTILETKGELR